MQHTIPQLIFPDNPSFSLFNPPHPTAALNLIPRRHGYKAPRENDRPPGVKSKFFEARARNGRAGRWDWQREAASEKTWKLERERRVFAGDKQGIFFSLVRVASARDREPSGRADSLIGNESYGGRAVSAARRCAGGGASAVASAAAAAAGLMHGGVLAECSWSIARHPGANVSRRERILFFFFFLLIGTRSATPYREMAFYALGREMKRGRATLRSPVSSQWRMRLGGCRCVGSGAGCPRNGWFSWVWFFGETRGWHVAEWIFAVVGAGDCRLFWAERWGIAGMSSGGFARGLGLMGETN